MTVAADLSIQHSPQLALRAAIAVTPALSCIFLIRWLLDSSVFNFVPSTWNDQPGYWHQILTFAHAGFNGGYYVPNELPAPVLRFDMPPFFTIIYGTVAHVIGWYWYSSIPVNMAVLACGIGFFVATGGMTTTQIVLTGVLALTFWPISLYVPTTSQEPLHQSLAFAMAALFYRLLSDPGRISKRFVLGFVALLGLASLLRMAWALLSLPLFVMIVIRISGTAPIAATTWRGYVTALARRWALPLLLATGLSAVFIGLAFLVAARTSPPGANSIVDVLREFQTSPRRGEEALYLRTVPSAREWLTFVPLDLYGVQKLFVSGLLLVLATRALDMLAGWRRHTSRLQRYSPAELFFHVFNLGAIVVGTVTVYLIGGAYRVIGAHLLVSLLLMIRFRRWVPVVVITAANVLVIGSFITEYRTWQPNFSLDLEELRTLQASIERNTIYDHNAPSPWCNTILVPISMYDFRVTLVPAGVGVSYIVGEAPNQLSDALGLPVKSRYLLLDDSTYKALAATGEFHVDRLEQMPIGTLYLNRDAACGPST